MEPLTHASPHLHNSYSHFSHFRGEKHEAQKGTPHPGGHSLPVAELGFELQFAQQGLVRA